VSSHFLRINGRFPILPVIAGLNFVASNEPKLLHDCSFLNAPSLYSLVSQACTSGFSISFCIYLSVVDHTTQLFWCCMGMHQNSRPLMMMMMIQFINHNSPFFGIPPSSHVLPSNRDAFHMD
jgi:hypothetical protein